MAGDSPQLYDGFPIKRLNGA